MKTVLVEEVVIEIELFEPLSLVIHLFVAVDKLQTIAMFMTNYFDNYYTDFYIKFNSYWHDLDNFSTNTSYYHISSIFLKHYLSVLLFFPLDLLQNLSFL